MKTQDLINMEAAASIARLDQRAGAIEVLTKELGEIQKTHEKRIGKISEELGNIKWALYLIAFVSLLEAPPVTSILSLFTKVLF